MVVDMKNRNMVSTHPTLKEAHAAAEKRNK